MPNELGNGLTGTAHIQDEYLGIVHPETRQHVSTKGYQLDHLP